MRQRRIVATASLVAVTLGALSACTPTVRVPSSSPSPVQLVDAPPELVSALPLNLRGRVIASGTSAGLSFALAFDGTTCALAVTNASAQFAMTIRRPVKSGDLVSPPAWAGATRHIGKAASVEGNGAVLTCGARGAIIVFTPAAPSLALVGKIHEHPGLAGSTGLVAMP
ncbi:MAG: hypothetical protein JWN36_806 [Microbacteriaceae bacterium]|nr:hypothetical protein [Microbacteriaceae bacterium]